MAGAGRGTTATGTQGGSQRPAQPPLPPPLGALLLRREKLAKGEEVNDDLSDLADPDMLAELAQSHKLAEAAAAAEADEHDDDPYGAGQLHESGGLLVL